MRCLRIAPGLAFGAVALVLFQAQVAPAGAISPSQERGRSIYLESRGSRGAILARLGAGGPEIPGEALLCADCHGRDGKGSLEGGVAASDVRWSALSKPARRSGASSRDRPAFDRKSLAQAITRGRDPAGHVLHVAMPLYEMDTSDLEDLMDYLQLLGSETAPGVSSEEIEVGALLPRTGHMADVGEAVSETLRAFFTAVNDRGGIHGRKVRLVLPEGVGQDAVAEVQELESRGVFCLATSLVESEQSRRVEDEVRRRGLPLIGPLGLASHVEIPPNPYVFHLLPGVADQVRTLIGYALSLPAPSIALAASEDEIGAEGRRAFDNEMSLHGAVPAAVVPIPSEADSVVNVVEALAQSRPSCVIVIGSPHQVNAAAAALRKAPWSPQVLSLAALYGKAVLDLPAAMAEGIVLAYPGPLPDDGERQLRIFTGFLEEAKVRPRFVAFQLVALAAAQVLVEGLRKAGRELTRDGLVAALESLRDYPTALSAPVTFGPNIRTGVRAARVVRPDPARHRFVFVESRPPEEAR